jgi:hypothetical protein
LAGERPISPLILAELYEAGDQQFVQRLIEHRGSFKPLLGIIEKWKKDKTARARQMKIAFITSDALSDDHRVIFKRLFKQAWHDGDDELMAVFMVVLDRWIRRKRSQQFYYQNRMSMAVEVLRMPTQGQAQLFTTPTKLYLRRRAWRYFRRMGFKAPEKYVPAVAKALVRYTNGDTQTGENLLDNWGLMHACFGKSPVLRFNGRHTNIRTEGRLADLQAAPMFERLWQAPHALAELLEILLAAQSRAVRVWAIQLLRRHHREALSSIDAALLLRLIDHTDTDVATFAAELLSDAKIVGSLPMTTWLRLLGTRNPTVVAAVVEAFRKHVNFDRVTLSQAVELANEAAVPVSRLGLEILEARPVKNDADRVAISQLAYARSVATGGQIAAFALKHLNAAGVYQLAQVIPFFDSSLITMRTGAFLALTDSSPAANDPAFWAALLESPYDDVRSRLVDRLKRRQTLPGVKADGLAVLWQSVLLNIHRGGRAKLAALSQISRQISDDPASAATLMPVVAVAIRSVRPPEARHGLAAVVAAVDRVPELAEVVSRFLPELQLDAGLAGAGAGAGAGGGR